MLGAEGRVAGLRVERNRLVPGAQGLSARGSGELETLPVGLVVRAIGYRSLPLPGLPFDERAGIVPNAAGRVVDLPLVDGAGSHGQVARDRERARRQSRRHGRSAG